MFSTNLLCLCMVRDRSLNMGGGAGGFSGGPPIFSQASKGGRSVFREDSRGGYLFFRKKI